MKNSIPSAKKQERKKEDFELMNVHGELVTNTLLATLGGTYGLCADCIDRLFRHFEVEADRDICRVPAKLMAEEGLPYLEPELGLQDCLSKLSERDEKTVLHLVLKNDIAVALTALGQYETYGVLSQGIQEMALLSLDRLKNTIKRLECEVDPELFAAIENTLKYEEQIMRNDFLLLCGVATFSIVEDIADVMVPWRDARSDGQYSVLVLWDRSMYDQFQCFQYRNGTKRIAAEQILRDACHATDEILLRDKKPASVPDTKGNHELMCFAHVKGPKQILLKVQKTNNPTFLLKQLPIPVGQDRFTVNEQMAIFELWFEKYGATLAAISSDSLEFTVERPPSSVEEAVLLAEQHYAYYPQIKNRFTGDGFIEELATLLMKSTVWRFAAY